MLLEGYGGFGPVLEGYGGQGPVLLEGYRGRVLCCWRSAGARSCAVGEVRGQGPVLLDEYGGRVLCCWRGMGAGSCVSWLLLAAPGLQLRSFQARTPLPT